MLASKFYFVDVLLTNPVNWGASTKPLVFQGGNLAMVFKGLSLRCASMYPISISASLACFCGLVLDSWGTEYDY